MRTDTSALGPTPVARLRNASHRGDPLTGSHRAREITRNRSKLKLGKRPRNEDTGMPPQAAINDWITTFRTGQIMRFDGLVDQLAAGAPAAEACREQDPVHDDIPIDQLQPNSTLFEASRLDLDIASILDEPFLDHVT